MPIRRPSRPKVRTSLFASTRYSAISRWPTIEAPSSVAASCGTISRIASRSWRDIGGDDALARRAIVGAPVEDRAAIAEIVPVILHAGDDPARRAVRHGEVDQGDLVARVGALGRADDQPAPVLRDFAHCCCSAGWSGRREDQPVGALRRAEPVEIDGLILVQLLELLLAGLREARVEEARAVLRPIEVGEFDPAHLVAGRPAGGDVEHAHGAPVGAAVLDRIEQMAAVLGRLPFGERGGAVLRPAVGIEQHARRAVQAVADVEDGLVLQPVIAGVEIMMALHLGDAEPFVIVHLGHPRAEGGAGRQGREEGAGSRWFCAVTQARTWSSRRTSFSSQR